MAMEHEPIEPRVHPSDLGDPLAISNGSTRDYLNVFFDLAMRLEQLPQMPEVAEHVMGWRSADANALREQLLSDAIYHGLTANSRERFDTCLAELDLIALASVAAVRRQFRDGPPRSFDGVTPICHRASHKMRVVLSRATRLVKEPGRRRA